MAASAQPPGPLPSLLQAVCRPLVARTRRQRNLAEAGSPAERAAIEVSERDRWLDRLVNLLQEAGLPVVAIAAPACVCFVCVGLSALRGLTSQWRGEEGG